jgi:cytochrome c oxidase cbb3-type subunit 4
MDITTLRIVTTLASFAIFIGILVWTFSSRNRERFEEAARLPFEQD